MITFNEFKQKVTFGYMAYEDKLHVTMFFDKFSKYVEVHINVFVRPGQSVNMTFEKLREAITDKIYYWYEELKEKLEHLYPTQSVIEQKQDEMIQLEFNF